MKTHYTSKRVDVISLLFFLISPLCPETFNRNIREVSPPSCRRVWSALLCKHQSGTDRAAASNFLLLFSVFYFCAFPFQMLPTRVGAGTQPLSGYNNRVQTFYFIFNFCCCLPERPCFLMSLRQRQHGARSSVWPERPCARAHKRLGPILFTRLILKPK